MFTQSPIPYLSLAARDSAENISISNKPPSRYWQFHLLFLHALLLASLALNFSLSRSLFPQSTPRSSTPTALYSPAQSAIEYKTVKFHTGFGADLPVYDRPPSPEVDAAWDSLYEFALNKVSRDEAALMTNKTYPILGEEGHYMIALDVFHQLHCLNEMRKAMYPEYYPITGEGIHTPHMQHCISSLRQSVTCSADISTIVWQWSDKSQAAKERSDIVHTCRDFEKIKDWAREHFVPSQQNMSIYIGDDLDIPTIWG